jgi:elongation factor G
VLDYAPDLRAITGGRGDYTMEFERYEEVPGQIAQKVIAQASDGDAEKAA